MSDTLIVVGTYLISYGVIFGYALYLHVRRRRASRLLSDASRGN